MPQNFNQIQSSMTEFSFLSISRVLLLVACLLACLLAAAAKPGRSTLDPKKGYKTKTSSTSSVTLSLIKTEYWDRAGGERNITFVAFCDFRRAKIAYNGLKMGSFHIVCAPQTV